MGCVRNGAIGSEVGNKATTTCNDASVTCSLDQQ